MKPKVLGVMLDTQLTFTQHCNNIAAKDHQRNNVLKALEGSTLGCNKEGLLTIYQAIGHSILSYCSPIWTPSPTDTNCSRLQRAQILSLRIAPGCRKLTHVTEMHQEARELTVRQHNVQIIQQFALACHLPQCPFHQLCHKTSDDRPDRRPSLIGQFKSDMQ